MWKKKIMKFYFTKSKITFPFSIHELYSEICIKGNEYKDQKIMFK